jgi:hypothetical protein
MDEVFKLSVTDEWGRIIYSQSSLKNTLTIEPNMFQRGIYFIHYETDVNKVCYKLVVY